MPAADRDERLAQILVDLDHPSHDGPVDVEALCGAHPDLADELRQLLAVGQIMDVLALSPATERPTLVQGRPRATLEMPRQIAHYDLVEEVGRGGMGVVYKAWDRQLERFVALKMILRGVHASASDQGRFRAEAQAAAGLSHPNIVPVYQVGEVDGQAFFCMKYVPGRTLAEVVKEGPLPQRGAAVFLAKIARAVHHAHQAGILHRDLKPANVLIDENDEPLVTDFGLAKRTEGDPSWTGTGAILGTPSYMPPEQAMGNSQPSPAGDVYSLGALLYELLTGRPPFLAASAVDTLLLVRTEEPVRPRLLNPGIDLDLELICRKCLEKRPQHRYASAARLADDLDAFLQGEPVSARSSSLVYFLSRIFRETHHAPVLEHWGLLWIWHSAMVLLLCGVTSLMHALGVDDHLPYLALWGIGLVVWGTIFWNLRRLGGPVTFVERQIAHVWAAAVIGSIGTFLVEVILGLQALILSPVLSVIAGMVFLIKAGTLSGWFYIASTISFLAAAPIALVGPPLGPLLLGLVLAMGFFVPGLKYYRQRLQSIRNDSLSGSWKERISS